MKFRVPWGKKANCHETACEIFRECSGHLEYLIEKLADKFPQSHPYILFRAARLAARTTLEHLPAFNGCWEPMGVYPDLADFQSPATPEGALQQELEISSARIEYAKLRIHMTMLSIAPLTSTQAIRLELALMGQDAEEAVVLDASNPQTHLHAHLTEYRTLRLQICERILDEYSAG